MKYVLTGRGDELETLVAQELLAITYRGRHAPVTMIETDLPLEELRERLPGYTVHPPKEYHTDDSRP